MRLCLTLLALASLGGPLLGETLTGGERNRAMSELYASQKMFLDAIAGLTPAQWTFRPAPEKWSIGQVAEHIALTEDLYWNGIQRNLAKPPAPEQRAGIKLRDDEVIPAMRDRSSKRTAVAANTPPETPADPAAVAERFKASRARLIEFVKTTEADLRNRVWPHRAYGPLDGFQWVLLACGHVERHVAQINEVKASDGYPGPGSD